MKLLSLTLALTLLQDPEAARKESSEAALRWLAKAENALLEAPAVRLKVERKVTMCVAPEVWVRKVHATVLMAKAGRLKMDSTESSLEGKSDADAVRTYVRCDGSNFGVAEGPDPDRPTEKKVRSIPKGFYENSAAVFIRAGIEVAYIGWPVATFKDDQLPSSAFAIEKARVVGETKVDERPAVQLEYEVWCFGKAYRHNLWIDRETLAPLKRICLETNPFDHARILGYEETYETVKRDVKLSEGDCALPKSWTTKP